MRVLFKKLKVFFFPYDIIKYVSVEFILAVPDVLNESCLLVASPETIM